MPHLPQNPRTLILFTANYPFACGGEDVFVGPEIEYLSAAFDRVIVVPGSKGGGSVDLSMGSDHMEGSMEGSHFFHGVRPHRSPPHRSPPCAFVTDVIHYVACGEVWSLSKEER